MYNKKIELNSYTNFFIFIILVPCIYLRGFDTMMPFNETQYLFNYEFEFLKRGFLGEILRLTFDEVNTQIIYFFSQFFLILLLIILYKKFFLDFNRKSNVYKLIFSITVITSPLTLQHFILDIGRQDIVNLVITFQALFLIDKLHKRNFFLASLILFISSIMLLIHEVSFFLFVPMIFGFWFYKSSYKNILNLQFLLFLFIILITALISTHGLSSKFSYIELNKYMLEKYIFTVETEKAVFFKSDTLMVLFRDLFNSYDPNVEHGIIGDTIKHTFKKRILINNVLILTLMSPIFFIVYKLYREFLKVSNFKTKILLISALSPTFMFFLGYDHLRWYSIIFTNIFIVIFYLSNQKSIYQKIILENVKKYKRLYLYLIPASLLLGPAGHVTTFDILAKFVY